MTKGKEDTKTETPLSKSELKDGLSLPVANFYVTISDTYCEKKYPLIISNEHSVRSVYEEICKHFEVEPWKV